jgi:hypothetical protein
MLGKNLPLHVMSTKQSSLLCGKDHVLEIVVPYIPNIRGLMMLFHTNRYMAGLMESQHGHTRISFIQTVAALTAYPSKGFLPDKIENTLKQIGDKRDLFQHVRALVCPWITVGMPVPIRDISADLPDSRMLTVREDVGDLVISSPLVEGKHFSVKIHEDCKSCVTRLCTPLEPEPVKGDQSFDEIQAKLHEPLDMNAFSCNERNGQRFNFFPIHGCVFAVVASYDGLDSDRVTHDNPGVYFFSIPFGEMLSHRVFPVSATNLKTFIQSRPFQMWILTKKTLYYMDGLKSINDPRMTCVSTPEERIETALVLASQGKLEEALHFMSIRISNATLETRARYNYRGLLHYAAQTGQGEVVEALLAMQCDPFPVGRGMVSPLLLAVRGYHHECVCLLACGMIIPFTIWESCWAELCAGFTMKSCFTRHPEKIQGYCRVSIPEITRILWNNRPPMDWTTCSRNIALATRSYTILSSKDALEFVLQQNIAPDTPFPMNRFTSQGGFKFIMSSTLSMMHDAEMIRSMRNAVLTLGMNINCTAGATTETHLVWAVRHGSPEAVRVLIEELGADMNACSASGSPIHAVVMSRLLTRPDVVDRFQVRVDSMHWGHEAETIMVYLNRVKTRSHGGFFVTLP